MANTRKSPEERRIMRAYSIKTKVAQDFSDYCRENNLSASRLVEDFIIDYLSTKHTSGNMVSD